MGKEPEAFDEFQIISIDMTDDLKSSVLEVVREGEKLHENDDKVSHPLSRYIFTKNIKDRTYSNTNSLHWHELHWHSLNELIMLEVT